MFQGSARCTDKDNPYECGFDSKGIDWIKKIQDIETWLMNGASFKRIDSIYVSHPKDSEGTFVKTNGKWVKTDGRKYTKENEPFDFSKIDITNNSLKDLLFFAFHSGKGCFALYERFYKPTPEETDKGSYVHDVEGGIRAIGVFENGKLSKTWNHYEDNQKWVGVTK